MTRAQLLVFNFVVADIGNGNVSSALTDFGCGWGFFPAITSEQE
jgi:hypothetical protein